MVSLFVDSFLTSYRFKKDKEDNNSAKSNRVGNSSDLENQNQVHKPEYYSSSFKRVNFCSKASS